MVEEKVKPEEATLLLIEDDDPFREDLTDRLSESGYHVLAVGSGDAGKDRVETNSPDLIISDLKMPGTSGLDVLDWLNERNFDIPLILITAYGKRENALEALRKGAFGYIQKPFKTTELEFMIQKALTHHYLARKNEIMERTRSSESHDIVWGESDEMQELRETVKKVAPTDSTALVQGESGVGKELIARALHRNSSRNQQPFIAVNCAALSAGLLESELFGHEKGAFTGAERQRTGRFELAHRGTILLDEISEIDPDLQAKILRVLEEETFERVGSSQTRSVDVRVIATTNRDLEQEVEEGRFREDLYYRLNVVPINVPPLRKRKEDIPELARSFQKQYCEERGEEPGPISDDTMEVLQQYDWPGNVRELKNIIERSLVLSSDASPNTERIRSWLQKSREEAAAELEDGRLAGVNLDDLEREAIEATLEKFDGHRKKTAGALGIAERTLRNKIKKWDLDL